MRRGAVRRGAVRRGAERRGAERRGAVRRGAVRRGAERHLVDESVGLVYEAWLVSVLLCPLAELAEDVFFVCDQWARKSPCHVAEKL